ncbi:MAG: hypothetical protein WKF31_06490 [Thermoleophilaceae bacterium]
MATANDLSALPFGAGRDRRHVRRAIRGPRARRRLALEEVAATVPPSVSRREDVEHLRELARGRFVPVR